jgi:acetyl esterase
MPLQPQAKALLDVINQGPTPDFSTLEAPAVRELFDNMALAPAGGPEPVDRVEDRTIPGPAGDIPVRVYAPDSNGPLPLLAFFHGGGFVIGSIETHDGTCRSLANGAGCCVVSVDYRLAPEHPFPAAPEDCYAVTCWLSEHGAELGGDPTRLAVAGDSAGGNLAAVVALLCRDRGGPQLAHQLLVYPVIDHAFDTASYAENAEGYMLTTEMMKWFWEQYLEGPEAGRDPLASPIQADSHADLAPASVLTAEFDPLRDEGEAYAARLIAAGVPTKLVRYNGLFHGFFGMNALIDDAQSAVDQANADLRAAFA